MIDLSLYLVTDLDLAERAGHNLIDLARLAAANGVTSIQVREKGTSGGRFLRTVLDIATSVPPDVAVIINDRVDVFLAARSLGAAVAGVHVGQSDLPAAVVRDLIGPDAVLGVSASTRDELELARQTGADYVGIGAVHATATKADAPPELGLTGFAALVRASSLPAVGIGGVTAADLPAMRGAGAAGGAVVSAICSAPDPAAAVRELRAAWDGGVVRPVNLDAGTLVGGAR